MTLMDFEKLRHGTELIKRGFAKMQKGGVIMDVTTPEQARIAEEAGAVAVMALQAVPADIRKAGGVARMADPEIVQQIIDTVTIPVMAKARIGHFVEAEILEALGVDMIDESEVLTPADPYFHIDKTEFTVPFVCGARNLGEALRRINEGAAMIRTKGEAGTGDVSQAVKHMKQIMGEIRALGRKTKEELIIVSREIEAPIELVVETARMQRLPVVNFAAGGIATPADAALMMRLGADGVFVGSGIFKAEKPEKMAKAIVEAVNNFDNPVKLAEISKGTGAGMKGICADMIPIEEALQERGW
jgi:pyridoxal 5'-phosphate synthase pdxS subunit